MPAPASGKPFGYFISGQCGYIIYVSERDGANVNDFAL